VTLVLLALLWAAPASLYGDKKKKAAATPAPAPKTEQKLPDLSNIVFPLPPAVPRLKYLDYFSAQKPEPEQTKKKEIKRSSWMDRMAGVDPNSSSTPDKPKPRFQLLAPYGVAVDSKGLLYIADTKVGAIFIFNTENNDLTMIKHGSDAHFKNLFGLAMDDNDTLLAVDGALHHVLVFDANHKLLTSFGESEMKSPCGVAIDVENRLVYVADTGLDQVLVYDADSYKLLRKIGTTGKEHTLTDPGDFSKPTNVAVDKDGNLYVTDTLNDRVEVFDADGHFIRAFGKNGDGAGEFARHKGIAIDSDGHVWVADAMLCRLQVFTAEGEILMGVGSYGIGPAQFQAMTGVAVDRKNNRIFTAEELLGRVQMFRYFTTAEAKVELEKRDAELKKKTEARDAATKPQAPVVTPAPVETPAPAKNEVKNSEPTAGQPAPPPAK
jgi:DNA-binding beta-propeller fold protein YncE